MATVSPARIAQAGELRFLVHGVDWEGYETLIRLLPRTRITYDRGLVEFMSPLFPHTLYSKRLCLVVQIVCEELDLPQVAAGSTTFKRRAEERGLEPDESFYLENARRLRGLAPIDLEVDPPPDLAVEVDITSSSLDKLGIYAALGMGELWRFDGDEFEVRILQEDRSYQLVEASRAFPFLPIAEIPGLLQLWSTEQDETRWIKAFRAWVREVVVPLANDLPGGPA